MLSPAPRPLPFDLRIPGVPLRVHWTFFPAAAFLTTSEVWYPGGGERFRYILGAAFLALLVQGISEAIACRLLDAKSRVVISGFGGIAVAEPSLANSRQQVLVALAGPVGCLAFVALTVGALWMFNAEYAVDERNMLAWETNLPIDVRVGLLNERQFSLRSDFVAYLLLIVVLWSAVNLLPVWPLTGGRIALEFCKARAGPLDGPIVALMLSAMAAGLAVWGCWFGMKRDPGFILTLRWKFAMLWFGLLAVWSVIQMELARRRKIAFERADGADEAGDDPLD